MARRRYDHTLCRIGIGFAGVILLICGLDGCAVRNAADPSGTVPVVAQPVPFDQAIAKAADGMFRSFNLPGDSGVGSLPFIIDPLIDGSTGAESKATLYIQNQIIALTKQKYTRFRVQAFTPAALDERPLALVGTFNTIDKAGETKGDRYAWWICLVLIDLKSGKVVARGTARAELAGVDVTPLDYFRDSPAWSEDGATSAYVKNCQKTKVGDVADPHYLDGLLAASLIAQATEAYNDHRYQQAHDLYRSAAAVPGGDQVRVYIGLYMTSEKLGDRAAASDSFRKLVDYGLAHNRLAVKFLFQPGSTLFVSDRKTSEPYEMWLRQIAREAAAQDVCLEVTGHTTPTGLPPINRRLSLLRAEYVKDQLSQIEPPLGPRTVANGVGSQENLVGTGKDDDSDALDRRVEFSVGGNACGKAT